MGTRTQMIGKSVGKHKHKNKWNWNKRWDWQDNYDYQRDNTKLYIEPQAYEKLSYYVQLADGEISGFGKIEHVINTPKSRWKSDDKFILKDVEIFKQRCSGGGTTLNGEMLSKFIVEIAKRRQEPHDWRLWWHSHNDFGVSWSGVDEQAITELTDKEGAELLSICINKDLDIIARKDTHKAKGNGSWYHKQQETLDVRISPRLIHPTFLKCEREMKEKVKKSIIIYKEWKKGREEWWSDKPLLTYKPTEKFKYVQPITTRDASEMGLYFDTAIGLFIRYSDHKIFSLDEVRRGLRTPKGFSKSTTDFNIID